MAVRATVKRPASGKPGGKARQASRKKRRTRGQGPFSLTIPAAGQMIGLSRSAAYRAAHAGQIPTIEVNGGWIVPRLPWERMLGISNGQTKEENAEVA